MRRQSPKKHPAARGFSIIELLVVISIAALILGISYPFVSAMTSGSRTEAGLNVAGMASDVARQWVQYESWANDGGTVAPTQERYSGTAAIYCPTGEIRLVSNDPFARASTSPPGTPNFLEDRGPVQGESINGYRDMQQVEYILIPNGVGLAGIYRDNTGIRFIAPPFAVAYNELGQLSYGDADGYIYYDGNGSGTYSVNAGDRRPNGYDPSEWNDGREPGSNDPNGDPNYTGGLSLTLPFEPIECVPGIIVFSEDDFRSAGFSFDGGGTIDPTSDTAAWDWLNDNGRTIFFSPHTGVALRDEGE